MRSSTANARNIALVPVCRKAWGGRVLSKLSGLVVRKLPFGVFLIVACTMFVAVLGAAWAYVALFPMAYESRDYPALVAKTNLAAECRPGVVAVFGDSRAMAGVVPQDLSIPVENLALSGTSPIETYFMAQRLLRCPDLPRLVVIAHSASEFMSDDSFWQFGASMGLLNRTDLHNVEMDAQSLQDRSLEHSPKPPGLPYRLLTPLYAMRFPPLYFASLVNGYVVGRWQYNKEVLKTILNEKGHAFFGTARGSDVVADEAELVDWHVSPVINLYFNKTLALFAKNHVPVMILTLPVNQATCDHLPLDLQSRMSTYLAQFAGNGGDIKAVDSIIPCWPNSYFGDAWHFNAAGAAAFSPKLQNVLLAELRRDSGRSDIGGKDFVLTTKTVETQMEAPNE